MDHVERIGGGVARQAAEQRDEAHMRPLGARQILDDLVERSAVADADQLLLAAFQHVLEIMSARCRESTQRQRAFANRGRHGAEIQFPMCGDAVLERHALGRIAFDEHTHQAGLGRFRDQPIDLHPRETELLRDLFLRIAADEGEPRRTRREAAIVSLHLERFPSCSCLLNFSSDIELMCK